MIFVKGNITAIMETIFNAPIGAKEGEEACRGSVKGVKTGDAKGNMAGNLF